ncbi:MAG: RNA polymerase sigma factor [Deltaproteobacteria bacterium]|nr:RNA polymerase sigma factor [Deltaproteobacteria bacterium]
MSHTVQQQDHAPAPTGGPELTYLVEEAQAGNRAAFEQLMGHFQKDVFRMVYYRTRSSMDAEDLTQEVFMQAYKKISSLKEVDRFRSWLFQIALNRTRDFNRKRRFRNLFGTFGDTRETAETPARASDQPEALDNLMARDFWKQIELFLNKLSRMEKEVFLLRFMDHLSIKEISHALAKSESTVKTHLYRSVSKFKAEHSMHRWLQEGVT